MSQPGEDRGRLAPERAVSNGGVAFDIDRDLICTADRRGYFTSLNAGWERVLGWTREELMARPFIEFVHPEDAERTAQEAGEVGDADHELIDFENRYLCKDGGWRWLRWTARTDGETWFSVAFDITDRKETEERLRKVLTDEYLLAYSQPIVDQRLGSVAQQELLVRLRDGDGPGGVLEPADFLPDAERCGLIGIVDRWMASHAFALAGGGRAAEVNISARSMGDEELTADLADDLSRIGSAASRTVFEITETAAVENLDAARAFAERLADAGARFALDDFGTGFGSLTYLRHLPVSYLKIDQSFVADLATSGESRSVVRAIVAMAHELGVATVAEGIEDEDTLRLLRDYGVDFVQGFLIGRPAPLTARG